MSGDELEVAPNAFVRRVDTEDLRVAVLKRNYKRRVIQGDRPQKPVEAADAKQDTTETRPAARPILRRKKLRPTNSTLNLPEQVLRTPSVHDNPFLMSDSFSLKDFKDSTSSGESKVQHRLRRRGEYADDDDEDSVCLQSPTPPAPRDFVLESADVRRTPKAPATTMVGISTSPVAGHAGLLSCFVCGQR